MKKRVSLGIVCVVALSALLIGCQKRSAPEPQAPAGRAQSEGVGAIGATVTTSAGKVAGAMEQHDGQDVLVFRGIPYAAPPVGELRWKAPQPIAPWSDVRDATKWGNRCPQRAGEGLGEIGEDCLVLNVTTVAKSTNDKLPVMVFFHGGGLTSGTANSLTYNHSALPRRGVVLVTVNSRLGPIGYMAHPALTAEGNGSSGNYGTLDLIASLRWVHDNIAAFGGDADNVLIFGESGGGTKTLSALASPLARGLFHKAIIESGSALMSKERVTTLQAGEARGVKIATKLGLDKAKDTLAALRRATWEELIEAAADREVGFMANLVVDGHVLPLSVHDTFIQGKQHDVPLIVGANAGERGELLDTVPLLASAASRTAQSEVFVYNFSHMPAGWKKLPCVAFHGVEIPYVFGYIPEGLSNQTILYLSRGGGCTTNEHGADAKDHVVADQTMRMWVNFVKTGNPSVAGLVNWPAYTEETDQYLDIGETLEVKKGIKSAYVEPPKRTSDK